MNLLLALLLSQTAGYGYCSTGYVVQSIPRNGPLICVAAGGGGYTRTSGSTWSNATTSYTNILTISGLSASTRYLLNCTIIHRSSVATTGVRLRFNSTGTMSWMSIMTVMPSSATAMLYQHHTALATAGTQTASLITNVVGRIEGVFYTNTATNISVEGAAETTGTVYVDTTTCTTEAI